MGPICNLVGSFSRYCAWDLEQRFRVRVQGEGVVNGVWNKGSEDLENQFGRLLWAFRKGRIQGSKHILDQSWGIPLPGRVLGGLEQGFRERVQSRGLE